MERFNVETKALSPNLVRVTLTTLTELKENSVGKAEQQIIQQIEATGSGKDLQSASKKALARAEKKLELFKGQNVRIQIMKELKGDGDVAVNLGFGVFEEVPDSLSGKGPSPVSKRVEVIGVGKTIEKAEDNALNKARKYLGV